MRDEFLITRQGKQFVLFAGLLDEAHSQGLLGITTEMIQNPFEPGSDGTAIVLAKAAMPPLEKDGAIRTFTGLGDANAAAKGAGNAEKGAPLRMAETRAKARALRDAINVGTAALEELSDGEGASGGGGGPANPSNASQATQQAARRPQTASQPSNVAELKGKGDAKNANKDKPKNPAQKSQKELIHALLLEWQKDEKKAGAYLEKILENLEVDSLDQITKDDAEEIIEWINGKLPNEDEPIEDSEFDEDEVEG